MKASESKYNGYDRMWTAMFQNKRLPNEDLETYYLRIRPTHGDNDETEFHIGTRFALEVNCANEIKAEKKRVVVRKV